MANTIKAIKDFFSMSGNTVGMTEFKEFWGSLTEDEKLYYQNADLS